MNQESKEKFIEALHEHRDVEQAAQECMLSRKNIREMFRDLDFLNDVAELVRLFQWEATIKLSGAAATGNPRAIALLQRVKQESEFSAKKQIMVGLLNDDFEMINQ